MTEPVLTVISSLCFVSFTYLVHAARTVKATNNIACASFGVSLLIRNILSTHE